MSGLSWMAALLVAAYLVFPALGLLQILREHRS